MLLALTASLACLPMDAETLKKRGFEVLEQIRREYYLPATKLYCEDVSLPQSASRNPQSAIKKSGPAFNWGVGVMLSALNAAAKLNPKYRAWLREYADASRIYWNEKGPVPGYDVLPCPKPVDRYYDDNAWMVLALVETHEILGDKKYLEWASEALDYVLSGWDDKLGGGIYWRESDKKSKNTCSNAPAAAACLAVAKHRNRERLVAKARQILAWTQRTFQDPADHLFWDNVSLEGKQDKTKWSYNTGLFLRATMMLDPFLDIERDPADKTYDAAVTRWFDASTGALKDEGRFAHLLLEGLFAARPDNADLRVKARRALDFLYANVRDKNGRYAGRWDRKKDGKQTKWSLIDQASAARAFLFVAGK